MGMGPVESIQHLFIMIKHIAKNINQAVFHGRMNNHKESLIDVTPVVRHIK